jgi:hypothetical protein
MVHGDLVEEVLHAEGIVPDLLLELRVRLPPVDVTVGPLGEVMPDTVVMRLVAPETSLLPLSGSEVVTLLVGGVPPEDVLKEQLRLGDVDEL